MAVRRRPTAASLSPTSPNPSSPTPLTKNELNGESRVNGGTTRDDENEPTSPKIATSSARDDDDDWRRRTSSSLLSAVAVSLASLSALISLSLLIRGLIMNSDFHHGGECDMTWSHLKFLPVEVPPMPPPSSMTAAPSSARRYRVLKFVDLRDPRHRHLYDARTEGNSDDGQRTLRMEDNWCLQPRNSTAFRRGMDEAPYPNPGFPVLYVPGHWGDYKQARSAGAHGLGLTRSSVSRADVTKHAQALVDGTVNGGATGEDEFLFDVYAVDFDGEGAALHGSRLVRQSAFVARAVRVVADACGASSVTIVAHSVGGIVARSVPLLHPDTAGQLVRNIITIASPHAYMPWGFDGTVREFWEYVNSAGGIGEGLGGSERASAGGIKKGSNEEDDGRREVVTVLSISGGLRDELIPPDACEIDGGISVLSSSVMPPRTAPADSEYASYALAETTGLGMDHKASCWCHNLLIFVRKAIRTVAAAEDKRADRHTQNSLSGRIAVEELLWSMGVNESYWDGLARQERLLQEMYGFWTALALRAAAPYRLGALVALYIILAILYSLILVTTAGSGQIICISVSSNCRWKGNLDAPPRGSIMFSRFTSACTLYLLLPPLAILIHRALHRCGILGNTPSLCFDATAEAVLASWAAMLHATLTHMLFPLLSRATSWATRRGCQRGLTMNVGREGQSTKAEKANTGKVGCVMTPSLSIPVTFVASTAVTITYYALMKEAMVLNITSAFAACFISLAIHSLVASASLSCSHNGTSGDLCHGTRSRDAMLKQSSSALLLIVLPFFLAGKIVFALSLLTTGGQADGELFGEFQRARRARRVGSGDGGATDFVTSFWLSDLAITSITLLTMIALLQKW
eukprot:CAMPEP_0113539852 /NCGR_PEP_ID=MMETSP0015_2-20120614/8153_1 /TAXON_ID=2838 /ORGANISM="Odontella" /LENGTH=861 /DNA_ID=CAMNT_0000439587 /DNA_START=20 /DNA_END=2602 /DNA_ORIENTATION=+ /assembly_acc=CAM_ASM_000160